MSGLVLLLGVSILRAMELNRLQLALQCSLSLSKPETQGFAAPMGARSGIGGGAIAGLPVAGVPWGPSGAGVLLESGALLAGRGFKAGGVSFFAPQILAPIGFRGWWEPTDWFSLSALGGAYFAYPTASIRDQSGNRYAYSDRDLRRLDFGVQGGAGLTIFVGPRYDLFLESTYFVSALNVYSGDAAASWRWHDLETSFGIRLRLEPVVDEERE